jgi:hypothetical protein
VVLPPAEFIPDAVLEREALRVLHSHEREFGLVRLPVPIEQIVEFTLKLQLVWLEIDDTPESGVLARLDPDYLGWPTIQMNLRHQKHFAEYFGTEQYSLAHECGHWVCHYGWGRGEQYALEGFFDFAPDQRVLCRRLSSGDRRELQAERFASFLLLPEHLLRPRLAGLDFSRPLVVAMLARECGVSKTAMRKRLQALGVLVVGPDGQLAVPRRKAPPGALL